MGPGLLLRKNRDDSWDAQIERATTSFMISDVPP